MKKFIMKTLIILGAAMVLMLVNFSTQIAVNQYIKEMESEIEYLTEENFELQHMIRMERTL